RRARTLGLGAGNAGTHQLLGITRHVEFHLGIHLILQPFAMEHRAKKGPALEPEAHNSSNKVQDSSGSAFITPAIPPFRRFQFCASAANCRRPSAVSL